MSQAARTRRKSSPNLTIAARTRRKSSPNLTIAGELKISRQVKSKTWKLNSNLLHRNSAINGYHLNKVGTRGVVLPLHLFGEEINIIQLDWIILSTSPSPSSLWPWNHLFFPPADYVWLGFSQHSLNCLHPRTIAWVACNAPASIDGRFRIWCSV